MKKVLLFLAQGFEAYEASVFTDVIGWSRAFGIEGVDLVTNGLRSEIHCTWNLIVRPELEFDQVNTSNFDALAIPGGFEKAGLYEDAYDERCLNLMLNTRLEDFNPRTISFLTIEAIARNKAYLVDLVIDKILLFDASNLEQVLEKDLELWSEFIHLRKRKKEDQEK